LLYHFVSILIHLYVNSPPVSSSFSFETVPNKIIATASLRIPYPNSTAFNTGNFYAFIKEFAATVSVAQRTLLKINISVKLRALKILFKNIRYPAIKRNPITVPMIPKKLIIPKF